MDCWVAMNCLLRVLLAILMGMGIVWFEHWLTKAEKVGMGIIGGSAFLTLPVLIAAGESATPYDGWASVLFAFGNVVFFSGWMYRKRKHDLANERSNQAAQAHLISRGKI